MNRTTFLLAFIWLLAACSSTGDPAADSSGEEPTPMAAALAELVTNDHTFGDGPPPFSLYLIRSTTDPRAGGDASGAPAARPLTADERAAIEAAIAPFGPVRWIDDPSDWITESLEPRVEGAAILGVGEPIVDSDRAQVPVSLWCGGLCAIGLAYELERSGDEWQVTGTNGPAVIS
jgi:hypothetical protein